MNATIDARLNNLWERLHDSIADGSSPLKIVDVEKYITNSLSIGPFFYFIFSYPKRSIEFIHENIEQILGLDSKTSTLRDIMERVHPDDIDHLLSAEELVFAYLINDPCSDWICRNRLCYSYRALDANQQYRIFYHQSIALAVDQVGRLSKGIYIVTDISHLVSEVSYNVSLIGINGNQILSHLQVKDRTIGKMTEKPKFSERELEIIKLLAKGLNSTQIAKLLFISEETVRTHRKNVLAKADCKKTAELITFCIKLGFI